LRTHTARADPRNGKAGARRSESSAGRVYRADYDRTRRCSIQVEGLAIDKNLNMANLKWVLEEFFTAYFGVGQNRFRRTSIPEPSPKSTFSVRSLVAR
jgi:phenylalanyl-tRNA synthetase alpha chain